MSLEATRELAELLDVDELELLRANRDRPWRVESGVLAFDSLRPGDVLRHPRTGGEIEITSMGGPWLFGAAPLMFGSNGSGSSVVGSFQTALQTRINNLGTSAAATLRTETGVDVTQQRVATGAAAAASLAQNGFDPTSKADEDKLVAAVAGGLALIPGVGPLLGAAVEGLYQVGNAIACPTMHLAASLGLGALPPECGGAPCTTSGNWSTGGILSSNARQLPGRPSGSFAEFVCAALAQFAAQAANCKSSLPPGVIVDAAVKMWNQTHNGPAAAYLVPPLLTVNQGITAYGPPVILATWQNISGTGSAPSVRAGVDPYAMYAFGPVSAIPSSEHPNTNATNPGQFWPIAPVAIYNVDPPRLVMVNTGTALTAVQQLIPGLPNAATRFEKGKTYVASQAVPGADHNTGNALPGQTIMTEAAFLAFMPIAGFSPAQVLWWGPTSTTDDPSHLLTTTTGAGSWLSGIYALGVALRALRGLVIMLGTYEGPGADVPAGVYAYDVTGVMTPRQTVLAAAAAAAAAPMSTGAKVAIGAGVVALGAGGLWLGLGKPLTIQAAQTALGHLYGKLGT